MKLKALKKAVKENWHSIARDAIILTAGVSGYFASVELATMTDKAAEICQTLCSNLDFQNYMGDFGFTFIALVGTGVAFAVTPFYVNRTLENIIESYADAIIEMKRIRRRK